LPRPPASASIEESLGGALRLTQHGDALELYFRPLRSAGAAIALAAFGILAIVLPLFSALSLVAAGGSDTEGQLTLALIAGVIVPFVAFGAVFVALAVYLLANSLSVWVTAAEIQTMRCVFGLPVYRHRLSRADFDDIEPAAAARYESVFDTEPRYRLLARSRAAGARPVVVAEGLRGEERMSYVRALIMKRIAP
jgi:hypothetical protein